MDASSTPPGLTLAELVASEDCPVARVVRVTQYADQVGWLPQDLAAQRDRDVLKILETAPQSFIVAKTGLTPSRVCQLAARAAKGACTP